MLKKKKQLNTYLQNKNNKPEIWKVWKTARQHKSRLFCMFKDNKMKKYQYTVISGKIVLLKRKVKISWISTLNMGE